MIGRAGGDVADSVREPDLAAKVDFLRRPSAYPDAPRRGEAPETHMSWVFLTEQYVYKLKKPVRWDVLDFSTPELRRIDCEEEVRLNRRLARDVYLGVRALTLEPDGGLALDGAGRAVDWLVHMRRLPAESMLDHRIEAGRVEEDHVRPVARLLARFYAAAEAIPCTPQAYRERLAEGTRADWRELLRPAFGLPGEQVSAIAKEQLAFLERRADLFEQRVREGRIVEGHGDLRPEHICLGPEPAIIDCLEFSRDLRVLDPADELAFLALECERLGAPAVGGWFLAAYAEATGDEPPPELLAFHRAYRALRRAKIAVWHLNDPDVRDPERWRRRALAYLALAGP